MKLRKSRPSIALSIGCMSVASIPRRPDASPEKNADAASTHSSAVMPIPLVAARRPSYRTAAAPSEPPRAQHDIRDVRRPRRRVDAGLDRVQLDGEVLGE